MNPSQPSQTHAALWDSRLQDCLDDSLEAAERAAFESHVADCSSCRSQRDELRALDVALARWVGRPRLDESFDERLEKRIGLEKRIADGG